MGWAGYTLRQLTPGKPHTQTFDLVKHYPKQRLTGKIIVEMVYKPFTSYCILKDVCPVKKAPLGTPRGGGVLVVIIHRGLPLQRKHHTNLSVSLLFQGELRKTMVCILIISSFVLQELIKLRCSFTFFFGLDLDLCSL